MSRRQVSLPSFSNSVLKWLLFFQMPMPSKSMQQRSGLTNLPRSNDREAVNAKWNAIGWARLPVLLFRVMKRWKHQYGSREQSVRIRKKRRASCRLLDCDICVHVTLSNVSAVQRTLYSWIQLWFFLLKLRRCLTLNGSNVPIDSVGFSFF